MSIWWCVNVTVTLSLTHWHNSPIILKQFLLKHKKKHAQQYEIYTDGSKTSVGVGFAIVSTDFKYKYSLTSVAKVFTAELCAIDMAISLMQEKNLKNLTITAILKVL